MPLHRMAPGLSSPCKKQSQVRTAAVQFVSARACLQAPDAEMCLVHTCCASAIAERSHACHAFARPAHDICCYLASDITAV